MRSRPLSHRPVALCIAILFTTLAASLPAQAQPLADRLPADTVVYVGWAGADSLGSQYEGSHLKAILDASNASKFVDEFLPQVIQKIRQEEPQAAAMLGSVPPMGELWHKPWALAFSGFDMNGKGGQPMPRILFVCRPGDDAANFKRRLDAVVRQGRQMAGPGAPPTLIKAFRSGDLVGLSAGYDQPEAALADGAGAGGAGQSLAASAAF